MRRSAFGFGAWCLLSFALGVWLGFFGDPIAVLVGVVGGVGAVAWLARATRPWKGNRRLGLALGGLALIASSSWAGTTAGIALFPWFVRSHLRQYGQIANEARDALTRGSAETIVVASPRWEVRAAIAHRQTNGSIQVTLAFRGAGRLRIISGAPERNVEGEGSCLVEFAPSWFWDRPCNEVTATTDVARGVRALASSVIR